MGDRAAAWRRRAAELREIAASARDPAARHLLLALAQEYDELTATAAVMEQDEAQDRGPATA